MALITKLHARQILDSKSDPTIEVDVTLDDGSCARSSVPSGASTGVNEAVELRDKDPKVYGGKSVYGAVTTVNEVIAPKLIDMDPKDQRAIDQLLIDLDGTPNKSKLGGNAIVGVSMAVCKVAAVMQKIPLYRHIGMLSGNEHFVLPQPMILLLEGGKHGNWSTDIQEYMVLPDKEKFPTFEDKLAVGSTLFHTLEKVLLEKGMSAGVGFEGAFCPPQLTSNEEAIELLLEAIKRAGFEPGQDITLALDGAASEFIAADGSYHFKSKGGYILSASEWITTIQNWKKSYPIASLEDMLGQEDWEHWAELTTRIGGECAIVGDDLVTTNVTRIQKAIDQKAINSVLIKVNQIGTVSETLDAIKLTHEAGMHTVVSHRGGETNDDFIADLCVGTGAAQCKFGGPDRGERLAKYNQLLRIEEELRSR